jgi:ESX secretion system protein EccE
MHHPATQSQVAPPRLSYRRSVLGVRIGQFICWQLIAVLVILSVIRHGLAYSVIGGVAIAAGGLTIARWRHRWGYEWLVTAWTFGLTRRRLAMAGPALPVQVCPARLRSGAEAGVGYDGAGFSLIIAITAKPSAPPVVGLPVAALAALLDPHDAMVSAVQLVLRAELGGDDRSVIAGAYRNLGCSRLPRSQSTWLVLRHDPALSRYAVESAGSAHDVRTSLLRALAGRSGRALDLLTSLSLKGQVLDGPGAEEALTGALWPAEFAGGTEPAAIAPAPSWAAWHTHREQHVTYWLRRWPPGGLYALQQELAMIPARSVTTAVLVSLVADGQIGLTVTICVTASQDGDHGAVQHAVRAAAAACGARLTRLDGEHDRGVLATLPLGHPPGGRWLAWRPSGTHHGDLGTILPVTAGGVVIGPQAGGAHRGDPVGLPFFGAEGIGRVTVLADPLLHRLLGLRALASGARLQVVTAQPAPWLRLRNDAGQAHRMTVVRPGTKVPADGTRTDPWLIIDDTGSPSIVASSPWLAVVTALAQASPTNAVLPGQDAIMIQRSARTAADLVATSLGLPAEAARALADVPEGAVAIARPGGVRIAWLRPDDAERSILTSSLRSA